MTAACDVNQKYTVSKTLCNLGQWRMLTKEGDYNGDGRADCLITLNNGKGVMKISTLLNTGKNTGTVSFKGASILNIKLADWSCLGGGDLNGDGISDAVILQTRESAGKKSRAIQLLQLDENAKISKKVKAGSVNSNWEVIGFADADGNGTDNIMMRHKSGVIGYWKEWNNAKVVTLKSAAGCDYLGCGDFDGDGAAELLWKNTENGTLVEWDRAASSSLKEINLGKLSSVSGWNFYGIGDYDGDSQAELLWSSADGKKLAYSEAEKNKIGKLTVIVK